MSNFSFDDLWRKDFLKGVGLWIVIEIVSFLILPGIGAIEPGDRLKFWFGLSIPLGLGGAFLLGGSSRFVAIMNERASSSSRTVLSFLGQFGGSIGLAGIVFPFVMVASEFLAKIFVK